jgi:bifunctional NMN adenylyltransferase/nudix hydrolase
MASGPHALAVVLGHFRVPGHRPVALLRHALGLAPQVLLAIASSRLPRSVRNPFTFEERAALLRSTLSAEDNERVAVHALREWYEPRRAEDDLRHAAGSFAGEPVLLLRDEAEEDADRLPVPAGWQRAYYDFDSCSRNVDAASGHFWLEKPPDGAWAALQAQAPEAMHAFLRDWVHGEHFARLHEEAQLIAREKKAWSVAPYPVVLVTVDAVVQAAGHVLLVRRGRPPGKGLWALPGGFVERDETTYAAAVRELREETGLPLDDGEVARAFRGARVFDDPRRSQRGRVITHAHHFALDVPALPAVAGGDDAEAAQWMPIERLAALEEEFMDDHLHVLDSFLHLRR